MDPNMDTNFNLQDYHMSFASIDFPQQADDCGAILQGRCPQLLVQKRRKEKAKIAARARRSQEANIIMEMANELHISREKMRRIDKATVVRLTIEYLKAFEILCNNYLNIIPTEMTRSNEHDACRQPQAQQQQLVSMRQHQETNSGSLQIPKPKSITSSVFAPITKEISTHYLMIENDPTGKASFVLKADYEVSEEDDLTHLAPQAGEISIPLDVEPLDSIELDESLIKPRQNQSALPTYNDNFIFNY